MALNTHCPYCTEEVTRSDRTAWVTPWSPKIAHYECAYRQMVGSVRSQQGLEKRTGGPDEDPSDVIPRADALAALRYYRAAQAKRGAA